MARHSFLSFFFILLSFSITSSAFRWRCHQDDAENIREIFSELNLTLTQDCCRIHDAFQCDPNTSRVYSVRLAYFDHAEKIPDAIGKMTNIQYLDIHKMPNLRTEIPSFIANLVNLKMFSITWTNVSGTIPDWLHKLTNLESITFSFNNLSGSIPAFLAEVPRMTSIALDRNRFTGSIPESFGRFRNSLPTIKLGYNMLSGAIPRSLGAVDFNEIDLQHNDLTGDPSHLFNNRSKSTWFLDLSRNLFEFDMSNVVFPTRNLERIDLSHNMIWGSIPDQILEDTKLNFLNVSYNRLCGKIPQGGRLQEFGASSYMHNRCLCGQPVSAQC
ncbi:polygalacturonase inhibitor-like [Nymphaea colorata]|nr:polygalacturonase inhibitor-like [Nymphaea colorata]